MVDPLHGCGDDVGRRHNTLGSRRTRRAFPTSQRRPCRGLRLLSSHHEQHIRRHFGAWMEAWKHGSRNTVTLTRRHVASRNLGSQITIPLGAPILKESCFRFSHQRRFVSHSAKRYRHQRAYCVRYDDAVKPLLSATQRTTEELSIRSMRRRRHCERVCRHGF